MRFQPSSPNLRVLNLSIVDRTTDVVLLCFYLLFVVVLQSVLAMHDLTKGDGIGPAEEEVLLGPLGLLCPDLRALSDGLRKNARH